MTTEMVSRTSVVRRRIPVEDGDCFTRQPIEVSERVEELGQQQ
jgi:hypothetical protein